MERAVLVAAAQAAHLADLLRLEVLAQLRVHLALRTGHQAGAAVAHVSLLAQVVPLEEVVERGGAEGHRLPDAEIIRNGRHLVGAG